MKLQYSLSGFPKDEFDEAHRLVRSMSSRDVQFRQITDDMERLREVDQEFIGNLNETDAICAPIRKGVYDLWFNPRLDTNTDFFRVTMLHELTHAYCHMHHGWAFKSFHGRSIYHYGDIVNPIEDMDKQVLFMLSRYTRIKPKESYEDYCLRVKQDRDHIMTGAELEQDRVRGTYGRVSF